MLITIVAFAIGIVVGVLTQGVKITIAHQDNYKAPESIKKPFKPDADIKYDRIP